MDRVKLVVEDKCFGILEAMGEVFPEAKCQLCTVHFYRNVFSVIPRSKVRLVAKMLKAIHAQERKRTAREKTRAVVVSFPDGNSALMLGCARLRHVAGTHWGNKTYMNMKHLETASEDTSIAG